MSPDKDVDFLRLALPDEIATALSYVHSLSIRPFATTSKYNSPNLDLEQAGREMRVTDIVTGHYLKEGDQLQITLEAVDVANNRTVWRDTLNVGASDMIAMRGQIAAKVRQGLVPALGAGESSTKRVRVPRTKRPTTSTCAACRCPTRPLRIKKRLPCWSAPSVSMPPTRPPGVLSESATTTTPTTPMAAKPCLSARPLPTSGLLLSIRTTVTPPAC